MVNNNNNNNNKKTIIDVNKNDDESRWLSDVLKRVKR